MLRENGSPFREDIVKALKRLTIVLLITGGVPGDILEYKRMVNEDEKI